MEPRYTLTELASLAGLTPRTVRYYLSQGLLAVDATPGPGPKYDDAHLARLRLIKRLQRDHLPLAEIRGRLVDLDDQTVVALASAPEPPPPADTALAYLKRVSAPHRLTEAEFRPVLPPSERPSTPRTYEPPPRYVTSTPSRLERSQWERIELAPDVELHVRRPLPRSVAKQVDRLIGIARDLLREET